MRKVSPLSVLAFGCFLLLLISLTLHAFVGGGSDLGVYKGIAQRFNDILFTNKPVTLDGGYPPTAGVFFFAASYLPFSFTVNWFWFVTTCVYATIACTYIFFPKEKSLALLGSLLLTYFIVDPKLLFARYDLLLFLALYLALAFLEHKRVYAGMTFFTLAIGVKAIPIFALPVLLFLKGNAGTTWRKRILAFATTGTMTMLVLPIVFVGTMHTLENYRIAFTNHSIRPIQVESTWSGLTMVYDKLQGRKSPVANSFGSANNMSPGLARWADVIRWFGLGVVVAMNVCLLFVKRKISNSVFALILVLLLVSPIFSPQYVLWVVPGVLAIALENLLGLSRQRFPLLLLSLGVFVLVATRWLWPMFYGHFTQQQTWMMLSVHSLRTLAMVALVPLLLWREPGQKTKKSRK